MAMASGRWLRGWRG